MHCKLELDLSWTKDCVLIEYHDIRLAQILRLQALNL